MEGYLTIALPSLVLVVHAYFAYLFKERPIVILASLLGLKPFIDVYRVVNGVSHRGQFTPVFTMSLGRGIELSAESIPQIFLQTILVIAASVAGRDVSVMQYVTIAISIATSGFIAANIDYDMDCSEKYRREMPEICGWIPEAKSDRLKLVFLETFFLGSYTGMRVLSCAALGYIMPAALISWISLEFLAFTVAKVYFNTYWYVRPAPKVFSYIIHIICFMMLTFAPCLGLRNPYATICGFHYTVSLIYGYGCSSHGNHCVRPVS